MQGSVSILKLEDYTKQGLGSRFAKVPPAKQSEKGYGEENVFQSSPQGSLDSSLAPIPTPHFSPHYNVKRKEIIYLRKVYLAREIMATSESSRHTIIFSRKCLFLENKKNQEELNKAIGFLLSKPDQFNVYFTSYMHPSDEMLSAIPEGMHSFFKLRGKDLQEFIKDSSSSGETVIICGAVDEDLHVAAQTKSFLIAAGWVAPEEKVVKYGIPAPTPTKMRALIEIIVNQTSWYYLCTMDDPVPTKVVSLCLSNTYTVSPEERAMAEAFEAILKDGNDNPAIKQALICYLMAAIAHDKDFKEVQDWAVTPSSSTNPSQIMVDLKEHVRYMMYGRKYESVFIRHTATEKSRFNSRDDRQRDDYCLKHFQSICVNDKYKGRLKDRVVCVFDDYLTHGNTFEALRNLLIKCKVKKIIFVSIGKFKRKDESHYIQRSFSIEGDVYSKNYTAEFNTTARHEVKFDDAAQRSLENLKELAHRLR